MAISNATLAGLTRTQLLEMHYKMALLRRFEEKSAEEYTRGKIGGFMHLYIGQEAVGVGSIAALRPGDKILSSYREHGHAIARGMDPREVMAELSARPPAAAKEKAAPCTCGAMNSVFTVAMPSSARNCRLPRASPSPCNTRAWTASSLAISVMELSTKGPSTRRSTWPRSGNCPLSISVKITSTRWAWPCIKPGPSIH